MVLHSRRPSIKCECIGPHNTSRYGDRSTRSLCIQLWTANWRHAYWNVWSHYAKLPPQSVTDWCPLWQRLQSPVNKKFSNNLLQIKQTFSSRLERNRQGKIMAHIFETIPVQFSNMSRRPRRHSRISNPWSLQRLRFIIHRSISQVLPHGHGIPRTLYLAYGNQGWLFKNLTRFDIQQRSPVLPLRGWNLKRPRVPNPPERPLYQNQGDTSWHCKSTIQTKIHQSKLWSQDPKQ